MIKKWAYQYLNPKMNLWTKNHLEANSIKFLQKSNSRLQNRDNFDLVFGFFSRFIPKKNVTFDGFQFQFEINRKRDTELGKLRKLLEDVHLESEETAHLLKKKHQEIVVDFQEQIDVLSKAKARCVCAKVNGERFPVDFPRGNTKFHDRFVKENMHVLI